MLNLLRNVVAGNPPGVLKWVKDGLCDDMNNNEACNYDGGDCCGTRANKKFCLECKCICKNSVLQFIYLVHSDTFCFLNIRFYVLS